MLRWLVLAFSCLIVPASSPSQTDVPREARKQSIQGKVIEAKSGQPVRKANVEVIGGTEQSPGRHTATTSADGTFSIEGLTPGRYRVTLERAGFVQETKNQRQATFTLQPGQNLTGLVFRMQAAGVISGKIVDEDGDPIASVNVNATMGGTQRFGILRLNSGTGTSNDLGEYRIADLRPGKYLISAAPQERTPAAQDNEKGKMKERMVYTFTYYPGTVDRSQAVEVDVRAGEEASANFGVQMTRAYQVSGTVSGVPTGAMVQVFLTSKNEDMGMGMERMQQLTEGNRFEYPNVAPGTYVALMIVVKGMLSGGQPEMQMVRLTPLIQVDKADVEGVQLQAEPGGQIHGKFRLDTEGKFDWTQLNVTLLPIEDDAFGISLGIEGIGVAMFSGMNSNWVASSDGTFEMRNVPGGTYQLVVGAQSDSLRDYYTKSVIVSGRNVADSGFAVNGDMYLDVVVSARGATIEASVIDTKDRPVPYATVAVIPNSEHRSRPDSYQQQSTDEHGHFVARGLTPGSYVVLAFEELQEDVRQPAFLKTHEGKGEKVEVQEGSRKSVAVRVIPAEAEVP
jgi:carboxypeptidase family protein